MMTMQIVTLLLFVSVATCSSVEEAVRIAQCRAGCLEKFGEAPVTDEGCQQNGNCLLCWQYCGIFERVTTSGWDAICKMADYCPPGCQEACRFNKEASQMVAMTSARLFAHYSASHFTWGLTTPLTIPRPLPVFVLMERKHGEWSEVLQTVELSVDITSLDLRTPLRLLAVTRQGLLTQLQTEYSLIVEAEGIIDNVRDGAVDEENEIAEIDVEITDNGIPGLWKLEQLSLKRLGNLMAATVMWREQGDGGDYLVTWEVSGGGLKGHLYTDVTYVTLSLWPETIYRIQVELVTSPRDQPVRSKPLVIDTHQFSQKLPRAAPLAASARPLAISAHTEVLAGIGAGLVVFLVVLVAVVAFKRRRVASRQHSLEETKLNKAHLDVGDFLSSNVADRRLNWMTQDKNRSTGIPCLQQYHRKHPGIAVHVDPASSTVVHSSVKSSIPSSPATDFM